MSDPLEILVKRLKKIGIEIHLVGNFPWIYLYKVNGNVVKEKFQANHGFTIAYSPITLTGTTSFTDISEIFKIIRKYRKPKFQFLLYKLFKFNS